MQMCYSHLQGTVKPHLAPADPASIGVDLYPLLDGAA